MPPLAWLRTPELSPPADQSVYHGEGAILLVDAARHLPDDVVASGVKATLYDERGAALATAHAACSVLADARMPKYPPLRLNLAPPLPANATLCVGVHVVVNDAEVALTLGYAPLALFVKLADPSLTQPRAARDDAVALNVGAFQLAIRHGDERAVLERGVVLSEAMLAAGAPRVPCATLLVRLIAGGSSSARPTGGFPSRAVGFDEPDELQLLEEQPVPPAPPYGAGTYNSSKAYPSKSEVALYRTRVRREPQQALDAIHEAAERRDQLVSDVDEAEAWLKRLLDARNPADVYSLRHFAPYSPAVGLQLGVRCAYGLPHAAMSFALSSVYPPSGLYRKPTDISPANWRLNEAHDFAADLKGPVWPGPARHFPGVPLDPGTLLVVDIRCLEKPTTSSSLRSQGWAVVPVFGSEQPPAVDSGLHQLPLFDGVPTVDLLTTLSRAAAKPLAEWQRTIGQLSREKKFRAVDGASVVVQLLDAQRHGELDAPDGGLPPNVPLVRRRLPVGYEARYVRGNLKPSRPLRSYVGKIKGTVEKGAPKGTKPAPLTELELQDAANAAFRQAMGLPLPL